MSKNMLLDCRDISFTYPGSNTEVFKNMSYRLAGPGFHALFGPSGVGKTTLAKMMTGDINSFGGEISKSDIGRVLYTYNLERIPGWSTVREHLETTTPESNKAKVDDLVRVTAWAADLEQLQEQVHGVIHVDGERLDALHLGVE